VFVDAFVCGVSYELQANLILIVPSPLVPGLARKGKNKQPRALAWFTRLMELCFQMLKIK
jgi:hypothetical protein